MFLLFVVIFFNVQHVSTLGKRNSRLPMICMFYYDEDYDLIRTTNGTWFD